MQAKLKSYLIKQFNKKFDPDLSVEEMIDETVVLIGEARTEAIKTMSYGAKAGHAQTIIFPHLQAAVFAELARDYSEKLNYALPFEIVILEFDQPVKLQEGELLGIMVSYDVIEREEFEKFAERNDLPMDFELEEIPVNEEHHAATGIFKDHYSNATWKVSDRQATFSKEQNDQIKNLAIACIAYINCENVSLVRQAGAPPNVNRKRIKNGKRPLEDFYICKIRGVTYENNKNDPSGRSVSFRFDVRGHFRNLDDGRTTWVRAHQRGIKNEIYRPKIYKAE